MIQRRRIFSEVDRRELLAAVALCRLAMVKAAARAPIGSELYRDVQASIALFDELAFELTGNREHFWARPSAV